MAKLMSDALAKVVEEDPSFAKECEGKEPEELKKLFEAKGLDFEAEMKSLDLDALAELADKEDGELSPDQMKDVSGGFGIVTGAVAFGVGCYAGIQNRIAYEHKKYGRCQTYAWACSKCKR